MKLGVGSYTFGWAVGSDAHRPPHALSAADLIDHAAALRVGLVQLCDNLPATTFEPVAIESIAAKATLARVAIQVGTRGSQPMHLRRFIAIAGQLGSNILRLVIDAPGDEPTLETVIQRIATVTDDLSRADVTLAIENHDRFPAARLSRIIETVAHPRVGVCLDTVNSFGALEGPEFVVDRLGPHVVNLHLKDFDVVRPPHLQGFLIEGRPLGRGRLDVPWLLDRLATFGRDPDAIIEQWTPPEADEAATIAKEAAWASQSVAKAREWIAH